ncbi:MAG: cupredoxin domain-containing protein [Candidatus Yanofskybacteria bacterium]|nr:cupredoxin domain-containing protein [Candidatus Yanofskybacteria bacterium]
MNKILLLLLALGSIGAILYFINGETPETQNEQEQREESSLNGEEATLSSDVPPQIIIRYTDQGYEPNSVRVATGTEVTFVNESSGSMWVASAPHPTHHILPEFDARMGLPQGEQYSFTFTQSGTWQYHDHLRPQMNGEVIAE